MADTSRRARARTGRHRPMGSPRIGQPLKTTRGIHARESASRAFSHQHGIRAARIAYSNFASSVTVGQAGGFWLECHVRAPPDLHPHLQSCQVIQAAHGPQTVVRRASDSMRLSSVSSAVSRLGGGAHGVRSWVLRQCACGRRAETSLVLPICGPFDRSCRAECCRRPRSAGWPLGAPSASPLVTAEESESDRSWQNRPANRGVYGTRRVFGRDRPTIIPKPTLVMLAKDTGASPSCRAARPSAEISPRFWRAALRSHRARAVT